MIYLQTCTSYLFFLSENLLSQNNSIRTKTPHCVKSVRIRSYSDPHFPTFGLNAEKLRIQSKCVEIRTRITPNTDTFQAVPILMLS